MRRKLKVNMKPMAPYTKFRPHQEETIAEILASKEKASILEAPTGSGKTIIAMTVCSQFPQSIYLCSSKALQDQAAHDFPTVPVLKGRSNYRCEFNSFYKNSFPDLTADDCPLVYLKSDEEEGEGTESKDQCRKYCPYLIAKKRARRSPICILNTSYFLAECNYVGEFSGANMVIIDEADELDEEIQKFVSLTISDKTMERLHLPPPKYKTILESWQEWANTHIEHINRKIQETMPQAKSGDLKLVRYLKSIISLHGKMEKFIYIVDDTWIYEEKESGISFKPTWISQLMEEYLWKHAERYVLMSATPPLPTLLGIEHCKKISIPSQFPVENRTVNYYPVTSVTAKNKIEALPKMIPVIKEIITKHSNDKGLIHTVSYSNAQYIINSIKSDRLITHFSKDKQEVITTFKKSKEPNILVSPVLDRGIDLPYDLCRFIIIIKVPYPDLSDKQTNKRLYSSAFGQIWYAWMAACSMVQMTGRGVRARDDRCISYIIDKSFETLYGKYRNLFPSWWCEAVQLVEEI